MSVATEYYDLDSCLEYNDIGLALDDIDQLLAVYQGQNDGEQWRWVVLLKDGRFAFIQGGCDYTGWDCASWAQVWYAETAEDAARLAVSPEVAEVTLWGVRDDLLKQVQRGRNKTWRERTEHELLGDPQA